jgi:hypothetical protein
MEDEVFAAMAKLDSIAPPIDLTQAVTRLRAHGFGTEADVLLGRGDAAWTMLRGLRDALRRTDPAWCKLHHQEQISDEDLDLAIATLEDLLEVQP